MTNFYTNVTQWGNSLLVREVVDGERINTRVKYKPTLYAAAQKTTPFTTLKGGYVKPVEFNSIKQAKEWIEGYSNQPDLACGQTMFAYSYIADQFPNFVKWDTDSILIVTIDIETECENGFPDPHVAIEPLISITLKNHQTKKIMVWGVGKFNNTRDDVTYVECDTEGKLIQEFLTFWQAYYPDIITGWNTEFFDIPYICNRIKNLFGEDEVKRLSPWKSVFSKKVFSMGRDHQIYEIQGVAALDYYDLYRKFTYTNQESYRLDHIAYVELGERKDGNPFETFREWYQKDYQSFIEYNITDVELVDKLEDKMKLIELCLTMAYDAKVNYTDVLGSVKYWDILIYNHLRKKNIVIPQKKSNKKAEKYEGAYVKDPIVGMHNWVMSFDLNSLYPHLIMQYNISPETLYSKDKVPKMTVDKLLDKKVDTSILKGVTLTPNGALFKTDTKGFLPEIMETMYNDRVTFKRKMLEAKQQYENTKDPKLLKDISRYNNIQMAKKISLNSAYGAIGNAYFRYYDLLLAEAITTGGQLSIRWIERALNKYLNTLLETDKHDYVLASDTDSVYITFDGLVNKVFGDKQDTTKIINFLDTIATDKIEPFIDKSYQELAGYVNAHSNKMSMKREVIADKGIWTAKKRYILNAHDVEGVRYKEPQLKIMGIEAVKSSTPAPCRQKIKDALKIIMSGDEKMLNTFIQEFREEFMKLPLEEIAYPRSVNGIKKFTSSNGLFAKGAPIHCKGAILYNHLINKNNLSNKYELIQEGDKIKFLHLKEPNLYISTAISFMTKLPKELDFESIIDYDVQFTKSFVEPLKFITTKILWNIDDSYGTQGTLEDFFT
jgi:DNA polymerase elongation subunit (family B)